MTDKTITHNGREISVVSMDELVGELTPEAKAERFRKIAAEIDRRKLEEGESPAQRAPQKDSD